MKTEFLIPASQTSTMFLMVQRVAAGYRFHQRGTVPLAKAVALAEKFDTKFEWSADRVRRQFFKRKGLASANLFMFPDGPDTLNWWLLASEGSVEDRPQFKDCWHPKQPILWDSRYRIEHFQRPSEHGGGRRWTWQITPQRMAELQANVIYLCSHTTRLKELIGFYTALERMPGFHGIRHQVHQLYALGEKTWRGRSRQIWPVRPIEMRYVSFTQKLYADPPLRLKDLASGPIKPEFAASIDPILVGNSATNEPHDAMVNTRDTLILGASGHGNLS